MEELPGRIPPRAREEDATGYSAQKCAPVFQARSGEIDRQWFPVSPNHFRAVPFFDGITERL